MKLTTFSILLLLLYHYIKLSLKLHNNLFFTQLTIRIFHFSQRFSPDWP